MNFLDRFRARRKSPAEQWSTIREASADGWSPRAALAAEMLGPVKSVVDIGCGTMTLERHLPGVNYIPVDCVKRDERTIVLDFNKDRMVATGAEAACMLGVMEYVRPVPDLLRSIAENYPRLVTSYNCSDHPGFVKVGAGNTWVNAYTQTEIEHLFAESGLSIEKTIPHGLQTLWLLGSR